MRTCRCVPDGFVCTSCLTTAGERLTSMTPEQISMIIDGWQPEEAARAEVLLMMAADAKDEAKEALARENVRMRAALQQIVEHSGCEADSTVGADSFANGTADAHRACALIATEALEGS